METNLKSNHKERIAEANQGLAGQIARLNNDRFRLHYHMMPPAGWMNDPNGLIYFNGEYHVFYQHDPFQPVQGPMFWGHAKSPDLVHWEHLPVALAPSEPYDTVVIGGGGCWSGSAVDHDGKLTLMYTGHVDGRSPVEVQCLAISEDGVHFEKPAGNPVISGPPEDGCFGFRDPKVWKHGDTWYCVIGYGKDGLGKALLYTSEDLLTWKYVGVAAESDGTMGDMWECPDLFPIGDAGEHVLLISPMNIGATKTMYLSGNFDYESGILHTGYAERLDYGFDFYAPQTLLDDDGRRILIAWMSIWGAKMPEQEDGWSGAFTIPREVRLDADGTLRMLPVAELAALRGVQHTVGKQTIAADTVLSVPDILGDALEIIAVYDVNGSQEAEFGIQLRCSRDYGQFTEVRYHSGKRILQVDRNQSGIGDGGVSEVVLEPMEDGRIKLHIYLDRSSIELFANDGRKTITNRIYPDHSSTGVRLFSRHGSAVLESLEVWELKSVWE